MDLALQAYEDTMAVLAAEDLSCHSSSYRRDQLRLQFLARAESMHNFMFAKAPADVFEQVGGNINGYHGPCAHVLAAYIAYFLRDFAAANPLGKAHRSKRR